ncbi:hypothetical protein J1605_014568 [Eschrichtius robustus]|uniref:Uncharacterized protein n=1 Tax=Eschrichtius robustus TaxID=9764 RepID=A0AB34GE28_ESCRO|nr:hypothetical protein J1605_014568 [Eschrichtius robustus]
MRRCHGTLAQSAGLQYACAVGRALRREEAAPERWGHFVLAGAGVTRWRRRRSDRGTPGAGAGGSGGSGIAALTHRSPFPARDVAAKVRQRGPPEASGPAWLP